MFARVFELNAQLKSDVDGEVYTRQKETTNTESAFNRLYSNGEWFIATEMEKFWKSFARHGFRDERAIDINYIWFVVDETCILRGQFTAHGIPTPNTPHQISHNAINRLKIDESIDGGSPINARFWWCNPFLPHIQLKL